MYEILVYYCAFSAYKVDIPLVQYATNENGDDCNSCSQYNCDVTIRGVSSFYLRLFIYAYKHNIIKTQI